VTANAVLVGIPHNLVFPLAGEIEEINAVNAVQFANSVAKSEGNR